MVCRCTETVCLKLQSCTAMTRPHWEALSPHWKGLSTALKGFVPALKGFIAALKGFVAELSKWLQFLRHWDCFLFWRFRILTFTSKILLSRFFSFLRPPIELRTISCYRLIILSTVVIIDPSWKMTHLCLWSWSFGAGNLRPSQATGTLLVVHKKPA